MVKMQILEPQFVTMETCLFQTSRSTPPSYTTSSSSLESQAGKQIRNRRSTERAKVMGAEKGLGKRREDKEGLHSFL